MASLKRRDVVNRKSYSGCDGCYTSSYGCNFYGIRVCRTSRGKSICRTRGLTGAACAPARARFFTSQILTACRHAFIGRWYHTEFSFTGGWRLHSQRRLACGRHVPRRGKSFISKRVYEGGNDKPRSKRNNNSNYSVGDGCFAGLEHLGVSHGGEHKNAADEKRNDGDWQNQVKQHEVNDVFRACVEMAKITRG